MLTKLFPGINITSANELGVASKERNHAPWLSNPDTMLG